MAPTLLDAPSRRLSHAPPGSVTLPTEASLPWGRQAERIGRPGSAGPGSGATRHGQIEIRECTLSVAGLVLAAGGGRRFGGPKALVRHEGSLLVERAVATARAGGCAPIVVVLGAGAAEVREHAGTAGRRLGGALRSRMAPREAHCRRPAGRLIVRINDSQD